ncbi:MAG: heavy metal-binding domain-containing protein [Solirubrobacteraceae bacterium]
MTARSGSSPRDAFTSNLSVADFSLCHGLGLRPISQVMGSSVYQVGYQTLEGPRFRAGQGALVIELTTLAEAWNAARDAAVRRIREDASQVGATAVVGVGLRSGLHDWSAAAGAGTIEYLATGTAVAGGASRGSAEPALSDLSLAEHSQLSRAGIEPLGIVAWTSVFFLTWSVNLLSGRQPNVDVWSNYEQTDITECFYSAREDVMAELDRQAQALNASGVLGVRLGHQTQRHTLGAQGREREGLLVTVSAIGTAVFEREAANTQPPQTTVDLTI